MTTLLAAHAFIALLAFALLPFPGILFLKAASHADVSTIRATFRVLVARGRFGGPLALLTALLGFWLVHVMEMSFTAGWLVGSYITFAILLLLGLGFHARWEARVLAIANAAPEGPQTPELRACFADSKVAILHGISLVCWFALFYLMILRPF